MFGEVPLLKVGVIMMALALLIAVVVSVALRTEPERLVAAEVAAKSPGEAPRYSSGEEGRATLQPPRKKDFPPFPSEEASLGYGSSSSGGSLGQRKEEAKEPQAELQQDADPPNSQSPMPQPAGQQAPSEPQSQPQQHQTQPQEQPLPAAEITDWARPTQGELRSAKRPRHYELLPGAIMGLTIEAIGIFDAPVFDSDGRWALAKGIAHYPQTSLPWSQSAQSRPRRLMGDEAGEGGTWLRCRLAPLSLVSRSV